MGKQKYEITWFTISQWQRQDLTQVSLTPKPACSVYCITVFSFERVNKEEGIHACMQQVITVHFYVMGAVAIVLKLFV